MMHLRPSIDRLPARFCASMHRLVLVMGGVLLAGCAAVMAPKAEQTLTPLAVFDANGAAPVAACTSLGGAPLQSLINDAFTDSPTLAQSWARLQQARAAARAQGATVLPTLSLSGEYRDTATVGSGNNTVTGIPQGGFGPGANIGGDPWQSTIAARYELDFWGRLHHRRQAARLSAEAAAADLRTAALSLSADIAIAWAEWVTAGHRQATLQRQLEDAEALVRLQALRFGRGQSDALALAQARQQAAALKAQRADAEGAEAQARLRLQLLLGRTPKQWSLPAAPDRLPGPEALPDAGLPSALLDRRPDLRAAWLRLQAADAQAAAAAAERWPRLTLSANLFSQAAQFGELFEQSLRQIAAGLDWTLFQGGALKARQQESEAVAVERLYGLEQAWLQALSEVQGALIGEAAATRRLQALGVQRGHAEQRLRQARRRYAQGQLAYLEVLSAQQALNTAELESLAARNARFVQRVNLCRGLAAGVAQPLPKPALIASDVEELP
ncbi:TolC family protein [Algiphilus sp.]|uniref:TolC family protein n=1 Tax=Algiphilus sp. TaxID=1872431 RepID=UPI0032F00E07